MCTPVPGAYALTLWRDDECYGNTSGLGVTGIVFDGYCSHLTVWPAALDVRIWVHLRILLDLLGSEYYIKYCKNTIGELAFSRLRVDW